jgi:hypothetical protein
VLLVLAGSLWLCRRPILEAAASALVVDQTPGDFEYILVLGGHQWASEWFDVTAELYREEPSRRVLLVEPAPERAVTLGVLPSYAERSCRVLEARGVPRRAVVLIPGKAPDLRAEVELLRTWLSARPETQVLALSGRFTSRAQRALLDRALPAEDAARVAVCALSTDGCNEGNWWHTRWGARAFMYAWLHLCHTHWGEGEGRSHSDWDPDEYERELASIAAEAGP